MSNIEYKYDILNNTLVLLTSCYLIVNLGELQSNVESSDTRLC